MRKHEAKSKKMIMRPAVTMVVTAGLMLSPVMQTMAFAQTAAPTDNQAETLAETQKVTEQDVKDAKNATDQKPLSSRGGTAVIAVPPLFWSRCKSILLPSYFAT